MHSFDDDGFRSGIAAGRKIAGELGMLSGKILLQVLPSGLYKCLNLLKSHYLLHEALSFQLPSDDSV